MNDNHCCRRSRWLLRLRRLLLCLWAGVLLSACVAITPTAPGPLVPTPIPSAAVLAPPVSPLDTQALDTPLLDTPLRGSAAISPTRTAPPLPAPYSLRWRMGIAVPDGRSPAPLAWIEPRPGWYLNWSVGYTETVAVASPGDLRRSHLVIPPDEAMGMAFVPLVWVHGEEIAPDAEWLAATVALLPGRTWLIGNEPDVKWQSNATPTQYAKAYHLAYTTIKQADPTAQVAIGGLSQITPLRLAYLDAVWAAYLDQQGTTLPVDVWTMHAFVLQEKLDDWGVDVPPGMDASAGMLWGIEQHDDLTLVAEQVRQMRAWMAAHGQQQKPLWVTEYGILMPPAYGFDMERVRRFMLGSFDLFRTLRDAEIGYGADDNRLVQRWVWFSTDDVIYPTGNLFTPAGAPTDLLRVIGAYLAEFGTPTAAP